MADYLIIFTATDVGMMVYYDPVNRICVTMHAFLVIYSMLVGLHCGPVADFFIASPSLHPSDFVRNLFSFLFVSFFLKIHLFTDYFFSIINIKIIYYQSFLLRKIILLLTCFYYKLRRCWFINYCMHQCMHIVPHSTAQP